MAETKLPPQTLCIVGTLKVPKAKDLKDYNSISKEVKSVIKAADDAVDAFKEANSFPAEVLHGCILTGDPDCRQLVYPNGLDSVYEKTVV